MPADLRASLARVALTVAVLSSLALPSPSAAQSGEYYAGKTLRVVVGLEAGGTADVFARGFSAQLRKHIPGNPTVVVQNMTGAGGSVAANYTYERAAPDGLTIVFNTFHPLAQALGDPSLRARFDQFEYIGGIGDVRVNYMRSDVVPGGAKKPTDIMKAGTTVVVGAISHADFSGTLGQLSLRVLGVKYKPVVGYRGGSDIFLAMQRGEVHFHNTSIGTFRTRSAAFMKSGQGLGISYLVPVANGNYRRSKLITEMPAYPDLYKEIHGRMPSGTDWEAFNWLTNQVGELAFIALAPPKIPPAALEALRTGFERATNDPAFIDESVKRNGIPYSYVSVPRGQAVIRNLAAVSPSVVETLRAAMSPQN